MVALGGAVFLSPQAEAKTVTKTFVADTFKRNVSAGWGSMGSGKAYVSASGAKRLSVKSGAGRMALTPGTSAQATQKTAKLADVTNQVSFSVSALPRAGNGVYAGPMVRVGSSGAYRLSARVVRGGDFRISLERLGSKGAVKVLKTSKVVARAAAGKPVTLRLRATGTTVVGDAWVNAKPKKLTSVSVKDSSSARLKTGSVAMWSYLSKGSQKTTVSVTSMKVTYVTTVPAPKPPAPKPPAPKPPAPKPPAPKPAVPTTAAAGSLPVGKASYAVPAKAVFVATSGSDTSKGTLASPFKTITKAVNASPTGSTIVVRGGTYHESVMVPKEKRVTIQAYPKEAVWLDGSSAVAGFRKSGKTWVKKGWTAEFDSSPTFSRGGKDGTTPGWQWVNPAYPMAAHPDQVWIGTRNLKQVGRLDEVTAGTFFVDDKANELRLGDDPTGQSVRASTLQLGLTVLSQKSVIKGIGIRRYAPSVPDMGAVRLFGADGSTLENVVVSESATTGLTIGLAKSDTPVTLRGVTVSDNGLMGVGVNRARGLVVQRVLVERNNHQRFNPAPSAGGFKLSNSVNVTVKDSSFAGNFGSGLWFDESSVGLSITRSDFANNKRHGLVIELSARVSVVNNAIWGNTDTGLLILDSHKVDVWNNSIRGSLLPVRISDGKRVATDKADPGNKPGMSLEATWVTKDVTVKNNAIGDAAIGASGANWCGLLCMLDDRKIATAKQMNAQIDGNLYYRAKVGAPANTVRWAGGRSGALSYSSLKAFTAAQGQERHGGEVLGITLVRTNGTLRTGGTQAKVGVPIPATIAKLGGLKSGATLVGAIRSA